MAATAVIRMTIVPRNVTGSPAETPNNMLLIARESPQEANSPRDTPMPLKPESAEGCSPANQRRRPQRHADADFLGALRD